MKRNPPTAIWIGTGFAVALALASFVLVVLGTGDKAIITALRLTARWSFVLFWFAYSGGALATLFGSALAPLARRGRELGLAYAAAQLVHLTLVVWLFRISPEPPISGSLFVFFSIGMLWTYLLAALSFGQLRIFVGPRWWRALQFVGVNFILLAFARDFVLVAVQSGAGSVRQAVEYLPFAALCGIAPLLRIAAAIRSHKPVSARPSKPLLQLDTEGASPEA
jgi:hypothetical protein